MSYISAINTGKDVLVWERTKFGREIKTYPSPYYFYTRDPDGPYRSLYGDKLIRHDFTSQADFTKTRATLKSHNETLFESDIPPELKVLSEWYFEVPAPKLNITFLDIEVDFDIKVGFASVLNPYAPINSVTLFHYHLNKYVVLAIPPNLASANRTNHKWQPGQASQELMDAIGESADIPDGMDITVTLCKNERDLLLKLTNEIEDSDVISGWNSDFFDVPYIGKRLEIIGPRYFRQLSFPEGLKPVWREIEKFGNKVMTLDLSGRISCDYMLLFQKYEMAERPSYKLESIADEFLPHLPKLEYEGSLYTLYRKNFPKFIRYNIRDTEILGGLEDILGYVELANQMMHLSTGLWKHVGGTIKLAELATINYCHHKQGGLVVNDFHPGDMNGSIQGAFVLIPQIDLHEKIGAVDINSLYPSSIRGINISPEKLMGQFANNIDDYLLVSVGSDEEVTCIFDSTTQVPDELKGRTLTATGAQWRSFLISRGWAISGYGTIFSQDEKGIIPQILEDWYDTRKMYQRKKAEAKEAGDAMHATYYDKLQYVYKIKLNSFYGALTNSYFRFYDLRMGESTTGTGRMILQHQCAKACEILDGVYQAPDVKEIDPDTGKVHIGYSKGWSVIYGDTDSTYFKTRGETIERAIEIADMVGDEINKSFEPFMQQSFLCTPGFSDKIKCGREIVSDRGIFVDKKRYILHIIDNEGYPADKLKVMGLDTKKTTLPRWIANDLNRFIERFLKGEEWSVIASDIVDYKDMLLTASIMDIGLPKGVKGVEEYTNSYMSDPKTRLPGHVAAAILYNTCLTMYDDKESVPIVSGMKIKVFYLMTKVSRFKSVALPVDIEEIPSWFEEKFAINKPAHIQRLVDNPLNNILRAIGKKSPTRRSLMLDDLLSE